MSSMFPFGSNPNFPTDPGLGAASSMTPNTTSGVSSTFAQSPNQALYASNSQDQSWMNHIVPMALVFCGTYYGKRHSPTAMREACAASALSGVGTMIYHYAVKPNVTQYNSIPLNGNGNGNGNAHANANFRRARRGFQEYDDDDDE